MQNLRASSAYNIRLSETSTAVVNMSLGLESIPATYCDLEKTT